MNEFDLIKTYFQRPTGLRSIALGVGDDCALLQVPEGQQLAVSIDTLVAGAHFPQDAEPALVGERALRVALSDLAAMGADPLWFTLALSLPAFDEDWLHGFSDGLMNASGLFSCALVGGDTTRGPLTISVQVHGSVGPGEALRRQGAASGDIVFVTGDLGDGAAALAMIQGEFSLGEAGKAYLMDRFYRPRPQLQAGRQLRGLASAAIDISDGLLADLGHICNASGVAAIIDVERLPLSEVVRAKADQTQREAWALSGGDDYQLCFTVPRKLAPRVQERIRRKQLNATAVGKIVEGQGVHCYKQGRAYKPAAKGYQHFGSH